MTNTFVYVGLGSEGGAEGYGLYRRSIDGDTWELKSDGLPADPEIRCIAIAPNDPSIIYTGAQDGLYRSNDRGESWEKVDLPGATVPIWSAEFHPNDPEVVYAGGEDAKLCVSKDGGNSWKLLPVNATFPSVTTTPQMMPKRVIGISVDPHSPDEIYAAVEVGGLIKSSDGGATWESVSEGHYQNDDPVDMHSVLVSSHRPRHVSTISRIGLSRSADGGKHWSPGRIQMLSQGGTYCRVIREHPTDPNTLYVGAGPEFRGTPGALFRSRDGGDNWNQVNLGLKLNCTLFGFAINRDEPSQMYAATRNGQVVGSHDGGKTWEDYSLPEGKSEVNALAIG